MEWYQYPYIGNYGEYPDPFGPYKKPDYNFECPPGTPITALGSGVVSGVQVNPSWGEGTTSVTIKLDTAINDIATHMAYNFLASTNVKQGDKVNVGNTIGTASSKYGFGVAFALTNDDVYGTATFDKYNGDPRLDPGLVIQPILNNGTIPGSNPLSSLLSGNTDIIVGIGIIALVLVGLVLFVGFGAL